MAGSFFVPGDIGPLLGRSLAGTAKSIFVGQIVCIDGPDSI